MSPKKIGCPIQNINTFVILACHCLISELRGVELMERSSYAWFDSPVCQVVCRAQQPLCSFYLPAAAAACGNPPSQIPGRLDRLRQSGRRSRHSCSTLGGEGERLKKLLVEGAFICSRRVVVRQDRFDLRHCCTMLD